MAPADVYFTRAAVQTSVKWPPIVEYAAADSTPDLTLCAFIVVVLGCPAFRRVVGRRLDSFRRRNQTFVADAASVCDFLRERSIAGCARERVATRDGMHR
jgi:hypothetical protein